MGPEDQIIARLRASVRPRRSVSLRDWVETNVRLPQGASVIPGRFQVDKTPAMALAYDLFNDPELRELWICSATQSGKTSVGVNVLLYHMAQEPAPALVVLPSEAAAVKFGRDKLENVMKQCPAVLGVVSPFGANNSDNQIFRKAYIGGSLDVVTAGSSTALAHVSKRVLVLDEIDKYPERLGKEGDPITLARRRAETFGESYKILGISTPAGGPDDSRIWQLATGEATKTYVYYPRCLACAELVEPSFSQVRWENNDPGTARFECPACGEAVTDSDKFAWIAGGKAVCRDPEKSNRRVGLIASGLVSPFISFARLVEERIDAGHEPDRLRAFHQSLLAEPYSDESVNVDPSGLMGRKEEYAAEVPDEVKLLTMAVDVQADRLEYELIGWRENLESYSIQYNMILGKVDQAEVWRKLESVIRAKYKHEAGYSMRVDVCLIDSGFMTDIVNTFALRMRQDYNLRVCAIKGIGTKSAPIVGRTLAQKGRKWDKRNLHTIPVGVHQAKLNALRFLAATPGEPGYRHFPDKPEYDKTYFEMLTSENLVHDRVKGSVFKKRTSGTRNESWDLFVYNIAAVRYLQPDWRILKARHLKRVRKWTERNAGAEDQGEVPTAKKGKQPTTQIDRSVFETGFGPKF